MKKESTDSEKRKRYILLFVCLIVVIYILQLVKLQIIDKDYKNWADSNAFYNKKIHPSRGAIYDRNGKLLVYNQQSYDVMVVFRETQAFDTLAFCRAVNLPVDQFLQKLADVKNRRLNPGYSYYTPQTFLTQLGSKEYGILQESLYKFPGFSIQNRTVREYDYKNAAHVLGYVAEVNKQEMEDDDYYALRDHMGKAGIERYYEKYLRGTKGVEVLLRDAHGRIKGKYEDGIHDRPPVAGKDLTLSIDIDLQAYGEELMRNKLGSIVMIEPKTGEILCMVSAPSYDPSLLVAGREFSNNYTVLANDPYKPLNNWSIGGTYPPGSTFKPTQALIFLEENIIQTGTAYSCNHGFPLGDGKPACHSHAPYLSLVPAIGNSCNAYFCWGLKAMLENKKYGTTQNAMDQWGNLMLAQGFGRPLGVDLPSEKRGNIPNGKSYDLMYNQRWNFFTIKSIAIGQGEIEATPLQICNLAATVANRGYYYTPHIVKKIKDTPSDSIYTKRKHTGISPAHYETVVEGMRWAIAGAGGTSREANIPDIEICGKTGTVENNSRLKAHSFFIAFAPKDDPKVAIAVVVENGGWGATYGVPIGRLMIEKYLNGEVSPAYRGKEESIKNAIVLRNALPKK